MRSGWLSHAGPYRVEHVPCPHPGSVDVGAPPKGIQHTTEGPLESALGKFLSIDAPHFLVGVDHKGRIRVLQLIPLGGEAAALKHTDPAEPTNGIVRVQIELADYTKQTPWLPHDPRVREALAALYATLWRDCQIPLRHSPIRRSVRLWPEATGWLGHIDVPQNDHVDAGALEYDVLFAEARTLLEQRRVPAAKVKVAPRKTDRLRTLPLRRRARRLAGLAQEAE